MAEICLDFDENTTLDELYEELFYYKKKNTNVCTYYKGHKLSNQNLEELKTLVERLKLNMNEAEYSVYAKKKKEEENISKFADEITYQKAKTKEIIRFWINTAKESVSNNLKTYFEISCYNHLSLSLIDGDFIIAVSKIIIKLDECDNEREIRNFLREIIANLPLAIDFDLFLAFLKKFAKKQYFL